MNIFNQKGQSWAWIIAIIVVVAIILVAVFWPSATDGATEVVKIGVIMPLTGSLGTIGEGTKDAVILAADEVNSSGILGNKKIELVIEDTACEPAKAMPVAEKFINLDKVVAVVGPACSGESLSTAPIFAAAKIPNISPISTAPKLTTEGGDYYFRNVPGDDFQAKVAADYVTNKWAAKTGAILYLQNDWGLGLQGAFDKSFTDLGGKIVLTETFDLGVMDAKPQLLKIQELNPDIVFLPCFPKECVVILKQVSELGLKSKIISPDGANDPETLKVLGSSINGLTTTIASNATENFLIKYKTKFGKDAVAYAGQSYDALKILAEAISKVGTDGEKIKDYLYTIDYDGAIGKVQFDEFGDIKGAKYDIFVWKDTKFDLAEQVSLK